MRGIQLRRHHRKRMINNRKHDFFTGDTRKSAMMHVTTPQMCSCFTCGSGRKFYKNGRLGMTIQQRRHYQDDGWDGNDIDGYDDN